MKQIVKTGLYASKAPLEWAVIGNGTLYTAQTPIDRAGQVVEGVSKPRAARQWIT
ncbi:hypothetical protein [Marinobacterium sedimentorum]|uniref:hypothetical protein n=1 Tax=Marinobacterium sedimentorum TaxID=2927804 RepID=UPI00279568E1|nr:hypothetical protein [Marinobacterium sedimentorum]